MFYYPELRYCYILHSLQRSKKGNITFIYPVATCFYKYLFLYLTLFIIIIVQDHILILKSLQP